MGSNPTQGMDTCIVCVHSVFCVVLCVGKESLRWADPAFMDSYRLHMAKAQKRAVDP
jgi:hypothetical protein